MTTPNYFETNPLQKFIIPVSNANIDDSTFYGMSLANKTIAGSIVNAITNVSVTVLVRTTKARGLMPNVISFTYKTVVVAPIKFNRQAIAIILRIGRSFKSPLYINVEANKQIEPNTESIL